MGEPVRLYGPFTSDGPNVLDKNGARVMICGYDHNRAHSGPPIADAVAQALNRWQGHRTEEPVRDDTIKRP